MRAPVRHPLERAMRPATAAGLAGHSPTR
jgi:ribosome modulation factor